MKRSKMLSLTEAVMDVIDEGSGLSSDKLEAYRKKREAQHKEIHAPRKGRVSKDLKAARAKADSKKKFTSKAYEVVSDRSWEKRLKAVHEHHQAAHAAIKHALDEHGYKKVPGAADEHMHTYVRHSTGVHEPTRIATVHHHVEAYHKKDDGTRHVGSRPELRVHAAGGGSWSGWHPSLPSRHHDEENSKKTPHEYIKNIHKSSNRDHSYARDSHKRRVREAHSSKGGSVW